MCMHSTKVVDNEIQASLYFKSTDTRAIYESMKRTVVDPAFAGMFTGTRADRLMRSITCRMTSIDEQLALYALAESDADFVMYCHLDLRLLFDDSRRVVNIKFNPTLTSLIEVQAGEY